MVESRKTLSDKVVDFFIYFSLTLFGLATLFPLYYVAVMSITPIAEVLRNGGFVLWPKRVTWEAYRFIFSSDRIPNALKITVIVTVLGTFCNLVVTTMLAYPLSKKHLRLRNPILIGIVFTMLFSGGLIPLYLVVSATGLLNSIGALIVPGLVSTFNMLIMKTYFENLPSEVEEAAKVDGCGDLLTLIRIVLPPVAADHGNDGLVLRRQSLECLLCRHYVFDGQSAHADSGRAAQHDRGPERKLRAGRQLRRNGPAAAGVDQDGDRGRRDASDPDRLPVPAKVLCQRHAARRGKRVDTAGGRR
ncbi:carbohydrate ABC transporter permease [Cohnella rhizosphaerae]|uniref:Carbohydrate ABC transporter permease n=1 Tax=Cohnella rhizosphaerae TaxID=1457232 RepID=A0A9X4KSY2_9BACL|nr:carbohydrate ABC transporter permease [Cohnella rhizosphaerae]MDG0810390.1 carbohydrate ABC transporter permease [Cohnella rhizosphaerae]